MTSSFEAQTTIRMELMFTEMGKIAGRVEFGGEGKSEAQFRTY